MKVIPVIDIRHGQAVQAVAGDRSNYRPLQSVLTPGTTPASVLEALIQHFGADTCYVADLDAIEGRPANRCAVAEMVRTGCRILLDSGIRCPRDAADLLDLGVHQVIVASESQSQLQELPKYIECCAAEQLIFSIDLRNGALITADADCRSLKPLDLVATVVGLGMTRLIVLDLSAVGTGTGIPTLQLCRQIREQWPQVELITGGGVHSPQCLGDALNAGIDGLLIASALHDGRITRENLQIQ